jgi:hypothetical protein
MPGTKPKMGEAAAGEGGDHPAISTTMPIRPPPTGEVLAGKPPGREETVAGEQTGDDVPREGK